MDVGDRSPHPKAAMSINIVVSKRNPPPEKRFIERDAKLCPVTAMAFWIVLLGPSVDGMLSFFACHNALAVFRGPSSDEVVAPHRFYLRTSGLMEPSETRR